MSIARNVDRPIIIIKVVIILGPLPAIGMAGRNARLIRIVAASIATHRIAALTGTGVPAAHQFVYRKSLKLRLNSSPSGSPFVGSEPSSGKWVDRHYLVPQRMLGFTS